jgi:hypothetical protein
MQVLKRGTMKVLFTKINQISKKQMADINIEINPLVWAFKYRSYGWTVVIFFKAYVIFAIK